MSKNYSFKKGLDQVPLGKVPDVKSEIMAALGITSLPSWLKRLRGEIDPKASEITAIENVFRKYGIKQVWGE